MPKEKIEEKLELIKKYVDNLARERARFLFGSQYKGEAHCDETTDIKLLADQILELLKFEREKDHQRFIEILERLKLEFDVNVCECGEKWNETDAADIVNEAIKQLKDEENEPERDYNAKGDAEREARAKYEAEMEDQAEKERRT